MLKTVTLHAGARYGYGGKQYIARIIGRNSKYTFEREFIGKKGGKRGEDSEAMVDEPGLYETRDIDNKGNSDDTYYVVFFQDENIQQISIDKSKAMDVAKNLDSIQNIGRELLIEKHEKSLETNSKREPSEMMTVKWVRGPWTYGQQVQAAELVEWTKQEIYRLNNSSKIVLQGNELALEELKKEKETLLKRLQEVEVLIDKICGSY